jgi:hypothetical protein
VAPAAVMKATAVTESAAALKPATAEVAAMEEWAAMVEVLVKSGTEPETGDQSAAVNCRG